jgi:hypothetical protein
MEVTRGQMLLELDGQFPPSLDQTTCLLLVQSVHTIRSMMLLSSQISAFDKQEVTCISYLKSTLYDTSK